MSIVNRISSFINNIGVHFHNIFLAPGERALKNKFVNTQPSPTNLKEDAAIKETAFLGGLFKTKTRTDKAMDEIVKTEQARCAILYNIAILQADVAHAAALRDGLIRHHQEIQAIKHSLARLQYVLKEGNDTSHVIAELNATGDTNPDLEEFLVLNNSDTIMKNNLSPSAFKAVTPETFDPHAR